ncbi:unnamed protein product [Plutella xylostella]|uniref:(diamondback moth) hypothetical protein n=1 Tax=Plutella xylostella TaxID=51655 RepID=A0A8S4E6D6_PLUXY|nr:unnamed protein product [Plutella xylostella]
MTNPTKKQMKIPRLFRKQAACLPEDCEELNEEIQQLEQKLKDKQMELFQAQRESYKSKLKPKTKKTDQFIRPDTIMAQNHIDSLERNLELMEMLTGMVVKSYEANDHCVVGYTMQHHSVHKVEHGLRINMKDGNNSVSKFSLPLGFNFNAVVEEFENILTPECLGSLRKALVAYYDRIEQFEALKKLLSIEAQLFKVMDGTHVEVSFKARTHDEEEPSVAVELLLDYRVYDTRPKVISVKDTGLPEGVADTLRDQCYIFKKKPLEVAFKECFMDGIGPYNFVQQLCRREAEQPPRPKRRRPQRYDPNNDDTFVPEDCSEPSEDEDERRLRDVYGRK